MFVFSFFFFCFAFFKCVVRPLALPVGRGSARSCLAAFLALMERPIKPGSFLSGALQTWPQAQVD